MQTSHVLKGSHPLQRIVQCISSITYRWRASGFCCIIWNENNEKKGQWFNIKSTLYKNTYSLNIMMTGDYYDRGVIIFIKNLRTLLDLIMLQSSSQKMILYFLNKFIKQNRDLNKQVYHVNRYSLSEFIWEHFHILMI